MTLGVITNPNGSRSAAYGGLTTCGSVWSCPVCAAKIATRRADDLATVMRTVDEMGGSAFLVTLTMRHTRGDRLGLSRPERARRTELEDRAWRRDLARQAGDDVDEDTAVREDDELAALDASEGCWDVLSYAWRSVTSGAMWQQDTDRFGGLLGWARAVEVTHGVNGWHVHVHVLLCFREQVSADLARAALGLRMFGRWSRALERRGFSASPEHGWDLRRAQLGDGDLADYFTKMAHEVTSGHRKEGHRHGGRTPMQLLGDTVETYEAGDMARWWEWETASDGRRQLTWSTGRRDLRTLAGLGHEATDEEIAAEDQDADERIAIPREAWEEVIRARKENDLLAAAERDGLDGARRWLSARGLAWTVAKPGDGPPRRELQPYGWRDDARAVLRWRRVLQS
ncbi:protein rep [Actinomycetospora soli]|uniref:protein rep n=1 Tax=Actinomycetospora soli TaxID=2893887 RepID=UPI001E572951|nr:protein rep [Actinomycetospora soli]MCD2188260.1 protein rep [Actinomycetospora soli]